MKMSVISYKDICKGVRMNGMFNHIDEDEEADTIHESFGFKFELEEEGANPLEEEGMQDGENSETNLLFVRLSKHERKAACMSTLGKVGDSEAIWKMIWPPFPKDTTSQALATCREFVNVDDATLRNKGDLDSLNVWAEHGKFDCVCIELHLKKTMLSKFKLHYKTYRVEYEGLHLICFECSRFGHRLESSPLIVCKNSFSSEVAIETNTCVNYGEPSLGEEIEENFGPWMMAKRKNGKLMARLETKGKPILPGPHLG
ncbi:unnamed protein product [Lupinus luteus]|uniref:Uncharacterized protein n=1 Tax=Lupinus luteus TaxID=3873 RepID=A0AAV1XZ28_LUPLU